MEAVREYLLRVTAAAVLCGIATGLLGKKDTLGAVVKMIAGIFMALTVVSPWVNIRLNALKDITSDISVSADDAVSEGEISAREAMAEIIIAETRAYILDKANDLGATLDVEVTLDADDSLTPCAVRLSGNISPYGKRVLSKMIEDDLGISTEEQIWTGQ